MSWFSDFFRNLFGRKPAAHTAPQAPVAPAPTSPYVPPAPSATAPDPAALEPVRPATALMTSGAGNDPGFVPEPPTVDVYSRPQPGAPYGRRQDGQPFGSLGERRAWFDAVAARDAQLKEAERLLATERYNGPIPVASLLPGEADFLTYVCSNYSLPGAANQSDVWFAILNGTREEINLQINQSDARVKVGYNPSSYPSDGRLRGLVDQVARGILKPVVTR